MEDSKQAIKGGEFLLRTVEAGSVFIPEEWNEEQRMIADSCYEFLKQEIHPIMDRIDSMEEGLMPSLLEKAGELGLLGISVPEELGGFGKDFTTSMISTEATGAGYSFSVALSAHTGIGTLPILYYGNADQKNKYIPKLASGEWKASYCLTEPSAGSDANSGKTKATLTEDGKHYLLNGQKMWITNAGFANVFTVFAKIDDDKNLSAFIVERGYEGISLNPEEHKMGIKGSSTRQVFFNDCKVPVENLLSERQQGFKIALNILNLGRIKLAGAALGGCKRTAMESIVYANERNQFNRPIAKYGAIRFKIAEQAIRIFAAESAIYRCSRDVDNAIAALQASGMEKGKALLKGVEQFATEAAILKVYGSEVLDYVVDEGVQIYGGMGYSAEAPMDRAYRDARINRIFEGTNEINRLLIMDMMMKKAMKGELDLMTPAKAVADELLSIPDFKDPDTAIFAAERTLLANFKKAVLMISGAAAQKFMQRLVLEQEVMMNCADMLIDIYIAESVMLRVEKLVSMRGEVDCSLQLDIMRTFIYDAADRVNKAGKDGINAFATGDEQRMMLSGLRRFTKATPFNSKDARQLIALQLLDAGEYCF